MKKDKEWLKDNILKLENNPSWGNSDYHLGYDDAFEMFEGLIDQLDEPEKVVVSKKETVEVPQFVADWIEKHKYSSDLIDLYSSIEYATDSDGFIEDKWQHSKEFYEWLSDDTDKIYLLADAMRYGYTIEKEPEWTVKLDNGRYVDNFIESIAGIEVEISHRLACTAPIRFKDKTKAEAVALLVGGEVEEVTK